MNFQIVGKRCESDRPAPHAVSTGVCDGDEALKLLVVFETDEDGWEVASCPTLPGCHSQGRTRDEALTNIREAIRVIWRVCASTAYQRPPRPSSKSWT